MRFHDRADAGRFLAGKLRDYRQHEDLIVLALPRGGVPVGYEVARSLGAPLDVFVVRKLGVPGHPELAMGAIASGGVCVLNPDVVSALGSDAGEAIESVIADETEELKSREKRYRDDRSDHAAAGCNLEKVHRPSFSFSAFSISAASSSLNSWASAARLYSSSAQAPKSSSLHRSEQNGRNSLPSN